MKSFAFKVFCLLTLLIALPAHASLSIDTKSKKYAALVMDADTGEVFYSRNADSRRYPASLTKMMTLYMLFEAVRDGDMTMNTRMAVSEYAASQPQTNISLKAGQTIKVKDAIKALVVRSANDVAVVVAEALGKNERDFALKMTQKARSLGMSKTQFRNPHGLPDTQQYTSARDMAKLSIALRRDFPQYYHYFKTQQFTWHGTTYKSHNRVLDQYDGVDGIKTGYIRMSGFNLATSVRKDGYHVVAVVMGGQTGRIRDKHMVSLLSKTFTTIAERGDEPRRFANAPIPSPKPRERNSLAGKLPWQIRLADKPATAKDEYKVASTAPIPVAKPAPRSTRNTAPKPAETNKESKPFFRFVAEPTKKQIINQNSLEFQLASLNDGPMMTEEWGIQVGAFRDQEAALKAAAKAVKLAGSLLKKTKIKITDHDVTQASIHRARLANLTEYQAKRACKALSKQNTPCFVFRFDGNRNL